ncbi:MAG TPA: ISAzo13 family transposase [Xanthobacteraceae bacterium]|nr:ISAzo13 family transposase [Xanthobacteraceae bacterium]
MMSLADLKRKFRAAWPHLDERTRRIMAATEAMSLGYGGVSLVSRACGLSRKAIRKGIGELGNRGKPLVGRIRRPGAGRKAITQSDPRLIRTLESLIDAQTRGDPQSPLRWICKSTRAIAAELGVHEHPVSHMKVAQILHNLDYSLQSNRKTLEGKDHPDRDAQFRHINLTVKKSLEQGIPVISVDTKKKELIGNYDNAGRQWRAARQPIAVQGHDFPSPEVPRAYPYGIYDIGRNAGFVNVGTDHDTGAFAVASIRGWWRAEGKRIYPNANTILITADAGGSNGWRLRLWKLELQKFADQSAMAISVCHFPPGTSKWNKIEHRLFSFISSNWRGEPLRDYETIINLIAATTTAKGLKVTCRLDRRKYPTGREVSDEQMRQVNLQPNKFHGEWNYCIKPNAKAT